MSDNILIDAQRLTSHDRQETYDHPLDNHQRIADYLNIFLGDQLSWALTARQAALMQIFVKLAREQHCQKRDNLLDIAGYARCVEMIDQKIAMSKPPLIVAKKESTDDFRFYDTHSWDEPQAHPCG